MMPQEGFMKPDNFNLLVEKTENIRSEDGDFKLGK